MPPAGVLSGRRGALFGRTDATPGNATCSGSAIATSRSAFVKQEFTGLNTRVSPRRRPQEDLVLSTRVEQQKQQQQQPPSPPQPPQQTIQKNSNATADKQQPPSRKPAPAKAGGSSSSRTGGWSTRICNEPGCTTVPSYGAPGTKRQFCRQVGGRGGTPGGYRRISQVFSP